MHIFVGSKASWETIPGVVPQYDEWPPKRMRAEQHLDGLHVRMKALVAERTEITGLDIRYQCVGGADNFGRYSKLQKTIEIVLVDHVYVRYMVPQRVAATFSNDFFICIQDTAYSSVTQRMKLTI